MTSVLTGSQIAIFRLKTLISAAKLEVKGIRMTRGRSASVILKETLGLSKRSSRAGAINFGLEKLAELQTCEVCNHSFRECECGTDPSEY